MRFGRVGMLALVGVALLVLVSLALKRSWEKPVPAVDGVRLIRAMQAYCRDQVAAGIPLPESVTLRELVNLRYVRADEVRGLEGVDLRFYTGGDAKDPKSVLARARLPDGSEMVVLSDGSIQQAGR